MVVAHLAWMLWLLAPKAPPAKPPPPLHNPLIIPEPTDDLSAYRLDTEVFGWNKAFTEVGVLAMEMARDKQGAHEGESYLLVYPTQSTVPKHNVICHFITHVALPHSPVPLENAGDYMWTIEWSYQHMWPKRPKHKRPKGAMEVTPLWAPMEPDAEAQAAPPTQIDPAPAPHGGARAPRRDLHSAGSCRPWVGFRLRRGQQVRLHPFRPLDMTARCELIRLTDSRTYWGTDDVAASMVRFDFNASSNNEESARFVVSALWSEARELRFVLDVPKTADGAAVRALRRAVSPWGRSVVRPRKDREGKGRPELVVESSAGFLPLARSLAMDAGYHDVTTKADEALGATVVLHLRNKQQRSDDVITTGPPKEDLQEPPAAKDHGTAAVQPRYLTDFEVLP